MSLTGQTLKQRKDAGIVATTATDTALLITQEQDGSVAKPIELKNLVTDRKDTILGQVLPPVTGELKTKKVILQNEENTKAESIPVQDLFYQASQGTMDIYGLKFRDINGDFEYIRTGTLAGIPTTEQSIIQHPVNETLLTVHNKMRRCVLNADGTVNYYLNAENSMYKADKVEISGEINAITENYQAGTIELTPKSTAGLSTAVIGSYIEVSGGALTHYALIVNYTSGKLVLSHPHYTGWGVGATDFKIGNAKLDGRDGQVMVEIPAFYHAYTQETDAQGYVWHHHQISLYDFTGAKRFKKRYISAFEGVAGNASGVASNGWIGSAWNDSTGVWTFNKTGVPTNQLLSVAGFYPQTNRTRSGLRGQSNAVGSNYHQYDFDSHFILQLLILIETGGFGSQERICRGVVDINSTQWSNYNAYNPIRKNGDTVQFGNQTSEISGISMKVETSNLAVKTFSYRGVENLWGHIWKWCDGINFRWFEEGQALFAKAFVSDNPRTHTDDTDAYLELNTKIYTHPDKSVASPHRYLRFISKEFLPANIPNESTNSNKYIKDYFYVPSHVGLAGAYRVLAVGGRSDFSSIAGAWCVTATSESGVSLASVGGRLCCFEEN